MVKFAIIAVFGLAIFALSCCVFSIVNKMLRPKVRPVRRYIHHRAYLGDKNN